MAKPKNNAQRMAQKIQKENNTKKNTETRLSGRNHQHSARCFKQKQMNVRACVILNANKLKEYSIMLI